MTNDDELRSRLGRLADTHELGDLTVDGVHGRHTRRVRRQRFATVGLMAVLVIGAASVVRLANQGDTIPDVASADDEAVTTTTTEPVIDATTTIPAPSPVGVDEAFAFVGGNIVPWGDGFLRFGEVYVESEATFTELIPDIADLFPPELIQALQDAGIEDANGASLEETMAALEEAGLMEEVSEIFQDSPELIEAFNQVQGGGTYEFEASTSPDGQVWTVLDEFAPPVTTDYFDRVESTGDALLLVSSEWADEGSNPIVTVVTTRDLVNWTATVVPTIVPDVPDWVDAYVRLDNIALGNDGWYGITSVSTNVDLWSRVPAAIRNEAQYSNGYGYSVGSEGLTINGSGLDTYADYSTSSGGADESDPATTTIPATTTTVAFGEQEPRLVTWDELGVSREDHERYTQQNEFAGTAFAGGFDGSLAEAALPADSGCCLLAATDAGFIAQTYAWAQEGRRSAESALFFSTNGQSWTELAFPSDELPNSLAAVAGGVVATTYGPAGTNVWRGDPTGSDWQLVTPEGLGQAAMSFNSGGSEGLAILVDLQEFDYTEPVFDLTFEHDGFELFSESGSSSISFRLTDLSTDEVVLDATMDYLSSYLPVFFREDLGSVVFIDEDGNDIVSIPEELLEQEFEAAREQAISETGWEEPDHEYNPDFSLVATIDGLDWSVIDLSDDIAGFGEAVVNNGVVIVLNHETGDYSSFTLG